MKTSFSQRTSRLQRVTLAAGMAGWLATLLAIPGSAMLLAIPGPAAGAQAQTMRQYQFDVVDGGVALVMKEVDRPVPGANEVLVRVRATSLNRRDLSILQSQYGGGNPRIGLVPLSDGAGEVIGVGPGVSRFEVGDRVAGIFFARWMDGRPSALTNASARGGAIDGMLSEMIVSHEDGLVEIPAHLTFEEAATLPCAGLTAWNALFKHGGLSEDDFVLLEGTGGVSIFGLQFSVAAGARPIITSSSDAKLVRARELGAYGTVNYRTNTEWQDEVRAITGDAGVTHVLEVGGRETLPRAMRALGYGAHIAIIGGLSGSANAMPLGSFIGRGTRVTGIYVGSREDFEAMNAFITEHRLRPIIDRVFTLEDAPAAYNHMASGSHLGKIVIAL